jgi:hypothetical protein
MAEPSEIGNDEPWCRIVGHMTSALGDAAKKQEKMTISARPIGFLADFTRASALRRILPVAVLAQLSARPPSPPSAPDGSLSWAKAMTGTGMSSSSRRLVAAIKPTAFPSRYRAVGFHRPAASTCPAASLAAAMLPSWSRLAARSLPGAAGWALAMARVDGSAEVPLEFAAAAGRRRGVDRAKKWPARSSGGPCSKIHKREWLMRISAAPEPSPPGGPQNGRPARPSRNRRRRP